MSDNIPCEIQQEILKRLPIKSLLDVRSVSKAWKSLIDSFAFIADYQHTELQQHILLRYGFKHKNVSVADDDTFPHQKVPLKVPQSVKLLDIVGCSEGLFCFYDYFETPSDRGTRTAVIWNPTIGKSVAVDVRNVLDRIRYKSVVSFGVCPHTLDPMLVNMSIESGPGESNTFTDTTWRVEIFRLSSRAWKSLSINLPRRTLVLKELYAQVIIDRFIYWLALDRISCSNLIISFDMISEVFAEIRLPDNLALNLNPYSDLFLHKFNGSLVVVDEDVPEFGVWMMENGDPESFIKFYTINRHIPAKAIIGDVFGFRKSGEVFIEVDSLEEEQDYELSAYDPKSEHIDYTGISAKESSIFLSAYTETLLLLDHPDCISTSL